MVAVGVAIFLACAAKAKPYEFLEKEPFETEYGVAGMVRERQKEYAPTYARLNITGTVLCILAAVPLFAAMCVSASGLFYIGAVCLLLVTAVYLFYTFGPMGNGQPKYSWFIWAVAGVLFGAVMLVVKLIARRK